MYPSANDRHNLGSPGTSSGGGGFPEAPAVVESSPAASGNADQTTPAHAQPRNGVSLSLNSLHISRPPVINAGR